MNQRAFTLKKVFSQAEFKRFTAEWLRSVEEEAKR